MPDDKNTGGRNNSGNTNNKKMASKHFTIEPFDHKTIKWSNWLDRLERAFEIYDVENEKQITYLLHYIGIEAYEVLADNIAPEKPKNTTYKELVRILKKIYQPQTLEIVENYKFHNYVQRDGETVEEFLVKLRGIAKNCGFGSYLEKALRNQFVFGLRNKYAQNKCLEDAELTLEKAVRIAKSAEASEAGGAVLGGRKEAAVNKVNSLNNSGGKNKNKNPGKSVKKEDLKCYRCGGTHFANKCKFIQSICSLCKKKGHIRRACMSRKRTERTNHVDDDTTFDHIFTIDHGGKDKLVKSIQVENTKINFEVDTGTKHTIVNKKIYDKYFSNKELVLPDIILTSYSGQNLNVLGYCMVEVQDSKKYKQKLKLYVVREDKQSLLGRTWIRALKINVNNILFEDNHVINVLENVSEKDILNQIKCKYPKVFSAEVGKIPNYKAQLKLVERVVPKFLKHRSIPFSIRPLVEKEIEAWVQEGILVKVEASRWATPVVPVIKNGGKVRLCGDYKVTVNPNLIVDNHPLPTVEEIFAKMSGGIKFSKIDLARAYLQLELAEEDSEVLTLNTHKGLYQPTRLMFGIASAPAIWQRLIETILQGLPGVAVYLDDIIITAPDDETHLRRLEQVFEKLQEWNMRVNFEKCRLFQNQIEYLGFRIDKNGIYKMKTKILAIANMAKPQNKEQVRAFLGLVNYYGRFLKNLSTMLYPLNNLLKDDVKFNWCEKCEKAFRAVKKEMQSDNFLTHYNANLPVLLATDASPYGVGAVLSHRFPDGTERTILYASQTLTRTQQRYSQIDKEAYAIIYGVRKFHQYIFGRQFTLITDNKPLSQIFSPKKGLPTLSATRMQHYACFLQGFNFDIAFRSTRDHGNADAMSRLPCEQLPEFERDEVDLIELKQIETLPVTVEELRKATTEDNDVGMLLQGLRYGRVVAAKDRFGVDQTEFSLQQGCILRGIRVYIPKSLRNRVLNELHSAHFGNTRMKELARSYCWWQGIDREIEEMVSNCAKCQTTRCNPAKVTTHSWDPSTEPFQRVHVDYAGPYLGKIFFVLIDAFSKWPEVYVVPNMTTETTIKTCRNIFSRFGLPKILVSDHGVQFTSHEFQTFLKINGIVHKMGAPYHPSTNGQAERYVQTIKQKLRLIPKNSDIETQLDRILFSYRIGPHPATGKSPAMSIFGRQPRSRLDLMLPGEVGKEKNPPVRELKVGEKVAAREYFKDKIKWMFGRVMAKVGLLHYKVELDDGRIWKRHIDQLRRVGNGIANHDNPIRETLTDVDFENITNTRLDSNKEGNERNCNEAEQKIQETNGIENETKMDLTNESDEIIQKEPTPNKKPSDITVRKSTRVRKPVIKLNL